jgi:hypothetical protein
MCAFLVGKGRVGKLEVCPAFVMDTTFDDDVIEHVYGVGDKDFIVDLNLYHCIAYSTTLLSNIQQTWAKTTPTQTCILRLQA